MEFNSPGDHSLNSHVTVTSSSIPSSTSVQSLSTSHLSSNSSLITLPSDNRIFASINNLTLFLEKASQEVSVHSSIPLTNQSSMDFHEFISTIRSNSLIEIGVFVVLMVIGIFGHLILLYDYRGNERNWNYLMKHLLYNDMAVILYVIGIEIGWRLQVTWEIGNIGCKMAMFLRAFPIYSTSFMVAVISIDRFLAITKPLSCFDAKSRNRKFVRGVYILSGLVSLPNVSSLLMYFFVSSPCFVNRMKYFL